MPAICPVCGKDDAIQKVSAIVQSGTVSGTVSGPSFGSVYVDGKWGLSTSWSTMGAHLTSDLARLLSAPEKPKRPFGLGTNALMALLLGLGCSCFFLVVAILISPFAVPAARTAGAVAVGPLALVGLFLVVGPAVAGFLLYRPLSNNDKPHEAKYLAETARWEQAIARWDQLYCCLRDGMVFDPETGANAPAYAIEPLLYPAASGPSIAGAGSTTDSSGLPRPSSAA